VTASDVALLRLYINDPAGDNQKFSDPTLQGAIDRAATDLYTAAAEMWGIKAATVSDWYQTGLDGSQLSRQQVWEHCMEMAKFYEERGTGGHELVNVELQVESDEALSK